MGDTSYIKQYVIYDHPDDYPYGFVVREWRISADGMLAGEARTATTLEEARTLLPEGSKRISGQDPNEPNIIEVWMES